jgi:hypothetical protein
MGKSKIRTLFTASCFVGLCVAGFTVEKLAQAMLLSALIGKGLEVFFTACLDDMKNPTEEVRGYSSPLYSPLYAMAPLVYLASHKLGLDHLRWGYRGLIYMTGLPLIEFTAMAFYDKALDLRPSKKSYQDSGHSFLGYTRWDFLPVWFVVGLFFEHIFKTSLLPLP